MYHWWGIVNPKKNMTKTEKIRYLIIYKYSIVETLKK